MRARLVWLVALAFLAGAIIAAATLSGGGGLLGGGNADTLLVEVSNVGHDARVDLLIYPAQAGPGNGRWQWDIPSGGTQVARYPDPPESVIVEISAVWTDDLGDHDGQVRFTADLDTCTSQTARMRVNIDTARGVSIRRDPALACEG